MRHFSERSGDFQKKNYWASQTLTYSTTEDAMGLMASSVECNIISGVGLACVGCVWAAALLNALLIAKVIIQ